MVAPAEQQLAVAHGALLQARGLQLDFTAAPPPARPPGWLRALVNAIGEAIRTASPVLKLVFWGGLAVGAALIVWLIVREALRLRGREQRTAVDDAWRPEPGVARALLEDADRLAGEGRFDEAVRVLLFRSIDELNGRRPGAVRPALTSRDLANLETIPQAARAAFAQIARAVETSFFGGRPLAADDFQAARRHYETYAFPESWR